MTGHPSTCAMPTCPNPANRVNYRGDQAVCALHVAVAVSGSWVDDRHVDGGHA